MIDFTQNPKKEGRAYGGSGPKFAIQYENNFYMLKFSEYPRASKVAMSHTNHHISEYIGCHIFSALGFDVQKTILGTYENKNVVACQDFLTGGEHIYEFENFLLQDHSSKDLNRLSIELICDTMDKQTLVPKEKIKEHFWNMFIVDAWIGNADRHSGNWGYIVNSNYDFVRCAPVYDCGSSLYPLISENEMEQMLADSALLSSVTINNPPAALYFNNAKINYLHLFKECNIKELKDAVKNIVPRINMDEITSIIRETSGISEIHKTFLNTVLSNRLERILIPALKQVLKNEKSPTINVSKPTGKGMER